MPPPPPPPPAYVILHTLQLVHMYPSLQSGAYTVPLIIAFIYLCIIQLVYMYPSLQEEPYSVPLEIAAINDHPQTVERLLEGGALINYQRPVCNTIITIVYTIFFTTP